MKTPESISAQLWTERANFPNLKDDEFASESELLNDIKKELRAIGSFKERSNISNKEIISCEKYSSAQFSLCQHVEYIVQLRSRLGNSWHRTSKLSR
jgi:hypothetical protein